MILAPGRRLRPAPGSARVNWANPVTRDLLDLVLLGEGDLATTNLVTGVRGTSSAFPPKGYGHAVSRVFDGGSTNYRIDHVVQARGTGEDMTVFGLVKIPTGGLAANRWILDHDTTVTTGRKWSLYVLSTGEPVFGMFNTAGTQGGVAGPAGTVSANNRLWAIGGFYRHSDSTAGIVYNGALTTAVTLAGTSIRSDHAAMRIGRIMAEAQPFYWYGDIHYVARWKRALRPEELIALSNDPWSIFDEPSPIYLTEVPGFLGALEGILGVLTLVATAFPPGALGAPVACGRAMTPPLAAPTAPADPTTLATPQGTPGTPATLETLSKPLLCGRAMTGSPPLGLGFTVAPSDPPALDPEDPPAEEGFFAWYGGFIAFSFIDGVPMTLENPYLLLLPHPLNGPVLADFGATGPWVLGDVLPLSEKTAFLAQVAIDHPEYIVVDRIDYLD